MKTILKKYWGYPGFRGNQEEAISSLLDKKDVIYVAKTGDGKSICFQIPAIKEKGTTIVVSPLKALMEDQVNNLQSKGIKATYLNSDLEYEESKKRFINLMNGEYDLLYVSPEKLSGDAFLEKLSEVRGGINYLIIDEFDCVDEYGSSGFRPEYLEVGNIKETLEEKLEKEIPVGVFTATASTKVQELIKDIFKMKDPDIYIGELIGSHILLDVQEFKDKADKDSNLFGYVKKISKELKKQGSGVIFCSTRKDVDNLEKQLKQHKFNVCKYHAGMAVSRKNSSAKKFMENKVDFIVCTNAFGRGVDKPDIRYVIHYGIPSNISAYLQEIGRAGRDGNTAYAITLFSGKDVNTRRFIARTQDQREELGKLIDFLDTSNCYISELNDYFNRESISECEQCSHCKEEIRIEIEKNDNFKVVKVPRKTTKRKTTRKKKTTTRKTPTKKRTITKKTTTRKKPVKRKTTTKKTPIKRRTTTKKTTTRKTSGTKKRTIKK